MTANAEMFRRLREQAAAKRPARLPPDSQTLKAIFLRERLEALLRPALDALREALPELQPVRRVDSGTWILGLARHLQPEDRPGRAARPFSRIQFSVEVDPALGTGAITCRATAFDRDLPGRLFAFRAEDVKDEDVEKLAEEFCLDFTRRYEEARSGAAAQRVEAEANFRAQLN